jgi:predicted metalloprotease with PDZ domain
MMNFKFLLGRLLLSLGLWNFALQARPIQLEVNATEAPRNILHARLLIPAAEGPLTLVYPKWIPGEHGPTGPIDDLTGLKITAGKQGVPWRRDADDMFAFHLDVPAGVESIEVTLDFLLPESGSFSSGGSATAQLLDLNWNQVLLYPQGSKASDVQISASVTLPRGWKFATALTPPGHRMGGAATFATVSLETLVDSPLIAGAFLRSVDLSPKGGPHHEMDVVADSAAALEIPAETVRHYAHLVTEEDAFFGARHYGTYHFLVTLSDHVAHFGLEHHESSDNREGEKYLTDGDELKRGAYLLPHEMIHSWNGKYRRPSGLATPDFQQPMRGELLWVYEGLTDYLGLIMAVRSGLWTNEDFREFVALDAAALDNSMGRTWRPLVDTTDAAQLAYDAPASGRAWRRGTDFYEEGDLIWLEADVIIRQQSGGHKSLEDFARTFYGGGNSAPKVIPYTRDDIVAALNDVVPYDWNNFFQKRIYETTTRAPLGGLEGGGWKLTYTNGVPALLKSREGARKYTDMRYSLGFSVKEDGEVVDVLPGSPADKAGLGPAMKLVAVNNRAWSPELLREAVKSAATNKAPVELLVENAEYFKTCPLNYHEGERYPQLERDPAKPDLLTEILKPLTPEPAP